MLRLYWVVALLALLAPCLTQAYKKLPLEAHQSLAQLSVPHRLRAEGSLLKPFLTPRVSGTPENAQVQKFIAEFFVNLDWHVQYDNFTDNTPHGQKQFTNIIVTKHVQAPKRLVLAAHFDSKYFGDEEFIGATDSAVPCALLLDIATSLDRLMSKQAADRDTTLQIIFFDGEEAFKQWTDTDSIYGARHLASAWETTFVVRHDLIGRPSTSLLDGIEVFVLLDLIGAANPQIPDYFQSTSWLFNHLVRLQNEISEKGVFPGNKDTLESVNFFYAEGTYRFVGGVGDDHIPFLRKGVPILHLIPIPFPSVWHTVHDNADALHFPTIDNWAILLRSFVAEYLELNPLDSVPHFELR